MKLKGYSLTLIFLSTNSVLKYLLKGPMFSSIPNSSNSGKISPIAALKIPSKILVASTIPCGEPSGNVKR